MRTFANLERLQKRLERSLAWDGYHRIRVAGKSYTMTEYGPGPGVKIGYDYCIFRNARTGEEIEIKYDCPRYQYIDGVSVQTGQYRFISMDVASATPWN